MVVVEVNGYTIKPGANLEGADLAGALLRDSNFSGANLSGADLKGANLEWATAAEDATWPDGFDPVAAGVIFD